MRHALLPAVIAALGLASPLLAARRGGDDVPAAVSPHALELLTQCQEHVAAARWSDALQAAELGLEYEPEHRELLDLASRAADEANEHDLALYYAETLRDLLGESKPDQELAKALAARIAELDLVGSQAGDVVRKYDELADSVLALARNCIGRGLYVNAVDLFLACKGTRHEAKAEAELDKLYAKEDVASALLKSGMDLPPRPLTREKARRLAAMDAKHATWPTAWRKETRNYDVRTDMGYQMVQEICTAMDEINRFYRKVFDPRGNPKKCKIEVFRSRKEFDQFNERISPSVRGFFVPSQTRTVTYDPRSDGRPLSALWSTLFHEASHQFTHEVSKGLVPGWLNEGTASYFEGARVLPNGAVEINLIPESRLEDLGDLLKMKKPELRDVVSYHQPGSYSGAYYPFGWGLVYFAHNFEDDRCERPYLAAYKGFLDSWRKNNEKTSAFDRFVDYFVTRPKRPGIASFEDFERLWKQWILELHGIYFGGPEKADVLLARARRQVQAKKLEAAMESYRFALRKRPGDLAALTELAGLYADQGARDAAILSLRRALQLARQMDAAAPVPNLQKSHGDVASECIDRIVKLEKSVGDGVRACVTGFSAAASATADLYWKGGFPRRALAVLDDAIGLLRGDHQLAGMKERIKQETGIELGRWRRIPFTADLAGFEGTRGFRVEGGVLASTYELPEGPEKDYLRKDDFQFLVSDEPLGSHYVVEAEIDCSDDDFATGVLFGESARKGMQLIVIGPARTLCTLEYDEEKGPDLASPKGQAKEGAVRLGAEVRLPADGSPGSVTFLLDGKPVGTETLDPLDFQPRAGVVAVASSGRIRDLRVRR